MGARHKLNSANLFGCLFVAALIGEVTGSGTVFFLAAAILILGALHAGDIRPRPRR